MMQVTRAIVRGGALWPLEPLQAGAGSRVRVVVSSPETGAEPETRAAERIRILEEMASLLAWDPVLGEPTPPTLEW